MHKMLQEPADFSIRTGALTAAPKKAEMPSLSDFVYPVLMDVDPAQLVEDEFKNKHSQVFCWRMLKLISQVDLTTFGADESQKNKPVFSVFEGNIEEQARILCKQFMKREILDHLPPDEDEIDGDEDKEMGEMCENNQLGDDQPENGHSEANGLLRGNSAGASARVVSDTPGEGKPSENTSVQTTKAH